VKRLVAFSAMLLCSAALVGCSSGETNPQEDPASFVKPGEEGGPLDVSKGAGGMPGMMSDKDKMKEKMAPGAGDSTDKK